MQKRIAAAIIVGMLAFSSAALPDVAHEAVYTAYASASYSDATTEKYAMQVAGIVNRERAANGLAPLKYSDKLSEAALVRAEEIQSVFSHTRPNGTRCFTAVTEAGINYRSVGENIAYGQRTPEEVMNSWMNSSGHRANILGAYDYIGIGVTYKNGTYYWSQFFAVSDNLNGKVITLGGENSSESTTSPTSKATTSKTTASTTAATSKTTASTTAATSKATASATAPTSIATASTTAPTSKVTTSKATTSTTASQKDNTCNTENSSKDCNCSRKTMLKNLLLSMLGMKNK